MTVFSPFQLLYHLKALLPVDQQTPQINRINGYCLSFFFLTRTHPSIENSWFYQGAQAKRKKLLGSTVGSVNRKAAAKLARHLWRWVTYIVASKPHVFSTISTVISLELPGINRVHHLFPGVVAEIFWWVLICKTFKEKHSSPFPSSKPVTFEAGIHSKPAFW